MARLLRVGGCLHADFAYATCWHQLQPPPTAAQVARYRVRFPTTPVTTMQPGTWDKLAVRMRRGMVRARVGDRLR